MARSVDYSELLGKLAGKRVLIWTCNTCARLCNGIGGTESCERLAERLSKDGIDVAGVVATSASCLEKKVFDKRDEMLSKQPDVILSITCSMGSANAEKVFGKVTINPIETFGYGILDKDGVPVLFRNGSYIPVGDLSAKASPFI